MNSEEKQKMQERVNQLKEELASLEDRLSRKENPFDVVSRGRAYYITADYKASSYNCWTEKEAKQYVACKDKDIIKKRSKREYLNALLEKFAYENDANVTEDMWKNEETKFHICKQYFNNTFGYSSAVATAYQDLSTIYFISKEVAERAITEIVIPFMEDKK